MKSIKVEVSWNTFWQILIFAGIVAVLYFARQAIGVLFTAIVISLGLDPAVSWLEKKKINRILGAVFVFLTALVILAIAVYLIVPILITEGGAFLTQFNQVFSDIFGIGVPEAAIEGLNQNLNKALGFITSTNISIGGAVSAVLTNVVLVLATLIISFYLTIEKDGTDRLLKVLLPDIYESSVLKVFGRFKEKMRVWLVAQLGLSLIVGFVTGLGLWLLDVKYFLILALVAAILELVPIIGPILTGAVVFLIAIAESFTLGIYVIIFFFLVQQLENNVLIPFLMKRAMKIHPVMVLIALLAGAQIAGFVGVILAVPIALLAQESFNYLAAQKDHRAKSGLGI